MVIKFKTVDFGTMKPMTLIRLYSGFIMVQMSDYDYDRWFITEAIDALKAAYKEQTGKDLDKAYGEWLKVFATPVLKKAIKASKGKAARKAAMNADIKAIAKRLKPIIAKEMKKILPIRMKKPEPNDTSTIDQVILTGRNTGKNAHLQKAAAKLHDVHFKGKAGKEAPKSGLRSGGFKK